VAHGGVARGEASLFVSPFDEGGAPAVAEWSWRDAFAEHGPAGAIECRPLVGARVQIPGTVAYLRLRALVSPESTPPERASERSRVPRTPSIALDRIELRAAAP
jgi:hypothetical protein